MNVKLCFSSIHALYIIIYYLVLQNFDGKDEKEKSCNGGNIGWMFPFQLVLFICIPTKLGEYLTLDQ